MKINTSLVIPFALSFSFAVAQENGAPTPSVRSVPPGAESVRAFAVSSEDSEIAVPLSAGADPYKDDGNRQPQVRVYPRAVPFTIIEDVRPGAAAQAPMFLDAVREKQQAPSHETLSFCYEEFSLPLQVMVDLQHKQVSDVALYEYVRKNHESDWEKAEIHREIFAVLRAKSGFPTSVKNHTTVVSLDSKARNQVGYHLDVMYDGSAGISLRFDLVNASITGHTKEMQEGKEVEVPLINEERIGATVTLDLNTASLVSTMNRAGSNQGPGSGPRVILGFVTASPIK